MKVAVLGAGGFIGGHLTRRLLDEGHEVRAVDVRPIAEWHQAFDRAENAQLDCGDQWDAHVAVGGVDHVYLLAADMGGMGFIETNKLACALNVLVTAHVLQAAAEMGVDRLFYASSACVYPAHLQSGPRLGWNSEAKWPVAAYEALRESDAYPADPEDGYGWEKLYGERLCRHFAEETGLQTRVARYHNIYGPHSAWRGGREKAPAALCRKVAMVELGLADHVEVWGDGSQYRSYTYIDDCVEGTRRLMDSDHAEPLNIGSSEGVTVDELLGLVMVASGIEGVDVTYLPDAPRGVDARNSDNTLCAYHLGWEPTTPLRAGIAATYRWVRDQLAADAGLTEVPEAVTFSE